MLASMTYEELTAAIRRDQARLAAGEMVYVPASAPRRRFAALEAFAAHGCRTLEFECGWSEVDDTGHRVRLGGPNVDLLVEQAKRSTGVWDSFGFDAWTLLKDYADEHDLCFDYEQVDDVGYFLHLLPQSER